MTRLLDLLPGVATELRLLFMTTHYAAHGPFIDALPKPRAASPGATCCATAGASNYAAPEPR